MPHKIILYLTYLIFLMLPWYHFNFFNTQPVDIVIIFTFLVLVISRQVIGGAFLKVSIIYFALVALSVYTLITFMLNYLVFTRTETIYLICLAVYIFIILITFISLINYLYMNNSKQEFYDKILQCLMIGTIVPIVFMLFDANNQSYRQLLSFYNPNQLAIYALLNMGILFYLTLFARTYSLKIKKAYSMILQNIYLLFFILSASRAAFGILLMYILLYFVLLNIKQMRTRPLLFAIICMCLLVMPSWLIIIHLISHMQGVRESGAFNFDVLISNAYTRMLDGINYNFEHVFNFIFGMGSETNPFRPEQLEFHNNFIGVFNQIGMLGFILYVLFNINVIRVLSRFGFLYFVPYLSYTEVSLFHYIFRERINWLFIAVLIIITAAKKIDIKKDMIHQLKQDILKNSMALDAE